MPSLIPGLFASLIAIFGIVVPFYMMYRTIAWGTGPHRLRFDKLSAVAIVAGMLLLMGFSAYVALKAYLLLDGLLS